MFLTVEVTVRMLNNELGMTIEHVNQSRNWYYAECQRVALQCLRKSINWGIEGALVMTVEGR